MHILSAPHSDFVKRVLPFVFAVGAGVWGCWPKHYEGTQSLIIGLMVVVAMNLIMLRTLRKGIWRMADVVEDRGDRLTVTRWKTTIEIPLANVREISRTPKLSGGEVTIVLRAPCEFGSEISFLAPDNRKRPGIDDALDDLSQRVATQGARDVA